MDSEKIIRKKLETLEHEIRLSYLKDLNKTFELKELKILLEEILTKDSLEEYFQNNQSDTEYFSKKFTNEILTNILRQSVVYGQDAHEIALSVFELYLQLFLKFYNKPHMQTYYLDLLDNIKDIFENGKSFYGNRDHTSAKDILALKNMTAEAYNENVLKIDLSLIDLKIGDIIDVMLEKVHYNTLHKFWTRGRILDINNSTLKVFTIEDKDILYINKLSSNYASKGTMTTDWEWRVSLKAGNMIDCLDRGKYYPATITNIREEEDQELRKIEYRIGFRVYPEYCPNWSDYKKYWPLKDSSAKDKSRKVYFGDNENLDEWIPYYSKRIDKLGARIKKPIYRREPSQEQKATADNYFIDKLIKFEDNNQRNYIIGRNNNFSYYFSLILKKFAENKGFDSIVDSMIISDSNLRPTSDMLHIALQILVRCAPNFHLDYIKIIANKVWKNLFQYFSVISPNDLRNLKKETIDVFFKTVSYFSKYVDEKDSKQASLENFSFYFAIQMIKTGSLDKKIQGAKIMIDLFKNNETFTKENISLFEQNNLFNELFINNTHLQLVTKSKEILPILINYDMMNNKEYELLWGLTKKGDIELKISIINILQDLCREDKLKDKHINFLLDKIFQIEELSTEEVDLMHDLCCSDSTSDDKIEQCISILLNTYFNSSHKYDNDKNIAKIKNSRFKIFELTKKNPNFKFKVINLCIDKLKKDDNSILSIKLMKKYIRDSSPDDFDFYEKLIKNSFLVNLIIENFNLYYTKVKNIKIEDLKEIKHEKQIRTRIKIIDLLLLQKYWLTDEINPVLYLHSVLCNETSIPLERNLFYNWLYDYLDIENLYDIDKEAIFKLFTEKILVNKDNCRYLTVKGFKTFLKLFLIVNESNGTISTEQNLMNINTLNELQITPLTTEDQILGFDSLWNIVFHNTIQDIQTISTEILMMLFKYEIENNTDRILGSTILMNKCKNIIKEIIKEKEQSNNIDVEAASVTLIRVLKILQNIIEKSEKDSSSFIKNHQNLRKKYVKHFKAISLTVKLQNCYLLVYGNTTMWELKNIISKKCGGIHPDLLQIIISRNEVTNADNNKTVHEMIKGDEIRIDLINYEPLIERVELVQNGQVIPELINIFEAWFDRFKKDEQMTISGLINVIKKTTQVYDDINESDTRIQYILKNYDKEGKKYLSREQFLQFFIDATLKPDKREAVWDNLHKMGIRNDLKNLDDEFNFQTKDIDKTNFPRYRLSKDSEFFDSLGKILDISASVANEGYNFINMLMTNSKIYQQIVKPTVDDKTKLVDWTNILDNKNINKLLYSLQIVESLIEDIELGKENIDSNDYDIALFDDDNINIKSIIKIKLKWLHDFFLLGGFNYLIKLLTLKINDVISSNKTSNFFGKEVHCIESIINIIKKFYIASLFKDRYLNTSDSSTTNTTTTNISILSENICKDKQILEIIGSIDHKLLLTDLMQYSIYYLQKSDLRPEENKQIEITYDFVIKLLIHTENLNLDDIIKYNFEMFKQNTLLGLLNPNCKQSIAQNLTILINTCKAIKYSFFPEKLFQCFFENINLFTGNRDNIDNNKGNKSSNNTNTNINNTIDKSNTNDTISQSLGLFIDLLILLFEVLLDLNQINIIKPYISIIINTLLTEIQTDNTNINPVDIFVGYMQIINKLALINKDIKLEIENKKLLDEILIKVIFQHQNKKTVEINNNSNSEYVNLESLEKSLNEKFNNQKITECCYKLVGSLMYNSMENINKYFEFTRNSNSIDNNTDINTNELKNIKKKSSNAKDTQTCIQKYKMYDSDNIGTNKEGYVGLKNLGCICYMNAMLQQFFMVPTLRYLFLQAKDNIPEVVNSDDVVDNVLYQVQEMFSYLSLSKREHYNMKGFCYAFKGFDGKPTNVYIQQDTQEFLNRFFDKMDNILDKTPLKYSIDSVFGGQTCSQLICEEGCGSTKTKYEPFYNLSLEVKNLKTVYESLDKFIIPEKIEDYKCESCNKKITVTKINSLSQLPNVLIIHLQRIYFDYDNLRNEKCNSRLEFPNVLNLKNYTMEELAKKKLNKVSVKNMGDNNQQSDMQDKLEEVEIEDTDEIYSRHDSYYEYNLKGVVIHIGSADSGHYYSYINTIRDGKNYESLYSPEDGTHFNSWLEFNDSIVKKFRVEDLEKESFGGDYSQSAYMLIYERKLKNPIKILLNEENIEKDEEFISYKEDEEIKIKKSFDLLRFKDIKDIERNSQELYNKKFFDLKKNEKFYFKPFYSVDKLIPKKYHEEITKDNLVLLKKKKEKDTDFIEFQDTLIRAFDQTLKELELNEDSALKLASKLLKMNFEDLTNKDKQCFIKPTVTKLISILEIKSIKILDFVLNYYLLNIDNGNIDKVVLSESSIISTNNTDLLYEILKSGFEYNKIYFVDHFTIKIEEEIKEIKETKELSKEINSGLNYSISAGTIKILDYLLSLFPSIPKEYLLKIGPLLLLFKKFALLGEEALQYFCYNSKMTVLCTFLMGKASPYYNKTLVNNESWDIDRPDLIGIEPLLDLIELVFKFDDKFFKSTNKRLLSKEDLDCIQSQEFLKYLSTKSNSNDLYFQLSFKSCIDNEAQTIELCTSWLKMLHKIGYHDKINDIIKLFNSIRPIFRVKDTLQELRFQLLFGIPQLNFDEMGYSYLFPTFGYHINEKQHTEYISLIENNETCCFLKKILYYFKNNVYICRDFFMVVLEECSTNVDLLKYLMSIPSENPKDDNVLLYMSKYLNNYSKTSYDKQMQKKLEDLEILINGHINNLQDKKVKRRYQNNNYLHSDIKREEVTLILKNEDRYLLKFEYFTSVIEYQDFNEVDYSKSKSRINLNGFDSDDEDGIMNIKKENKYDVSQNLEEKPDEYILIPFHMKPNSEMDFITNNLIYLLEESMSEITCNVRISLQGESQEKINELNEFLPMSWIKNKLYCDSLKTIFIMPKVNIKEDWSKLDDFNYEFNIEEKYKITTNTTDGDEIGPSRKTRNINDDTAAPAGIDLSVYQPGVSQHYNQKYFTNGDEYTLLKDSNQNDDDFYYNPDDFN